MTIALAIAIPLLIIALAIAIPLLIIAIVAWLIDREIARGRDPYDPREWK